MKKNVRILLIALLILALALTVTACGKKKKSTTAPTTSAPDTTPTVTTPTESPNTSSNLTTAPPATTDPNVVLYKITFMIDGKKNIVYVPEGEIPECPVSTDLPPTQILTFTFTGWDKEIKPATEDTIYVARYQKENRSYTVTFRVDGKVVATEKVRYGKRIVFPEDLPTPKKGIATVYRWTNTESYCTGDTVCDALFAWGDPDSVAWAYDFTLIKHQGIEDNNGDVPEASNAFLYLALSEHKYHSEAVQKRVLEHLRSFIRAAMSLCSVQAAIGRTHRSRSALCSAATPQPFGMS